MKRILFIALLSLFSLSVFCQNKGTLKFLGIPIDGTEAQFVSKLKSKGFTYNSIYKNYEGQFNGKDVDVFIHTNHNLVDRVYVAFPYTSEAGIRVEFNRLLSQFEETGKYMSFGMNEEIPADEDISYEISVHNKRYQASFSYIDPDRDPIALVDALLDKISDFFTEEQLAKLKEYINKAKNASESEQEALQAQMMAELQSQGLGQDTDSEFNPEKALRFLTTFVEGMKSLADGSVWFMIHEHLGRYQIGLYYDNLHNQAHGEDL